MEIYRQRAHCALSTVCKVTIKRPLVADFEVVTSRCNVVKFYIQGKSYSQKLNKTAITVVMVVEQ
jgi:hypothetical protein